jgi:protein-glutamine gamma-glutamyltransferase
MSQTKPSETSGASNWLRSLSRESRDTLFLLAVLAWIELPQSAHLPLWCSLLAAAMLLWRAVLAVRGGPLPSRAWLTSLLLLAMAATFYTYQTLLGRDAGVTFLVVLLALKTLELRARRDAFVIFFLGFFSLLSTLLYSQSLLTAASLLIGVLGLLTALVLAQLPVGRPSLRHAVRSAGLLALWGAPVMVLLFVLFPRVAPLWGLPADAMAGRSGLSDSMQVGNVARLALDRSVAMRVRFEGPAPEPRDLYFRGPVLTQYDGRVWQASPSLALLGAPAAPDLEVQSPALRYEITLEPQQQAWLPVLEATTQAPELAGYTVRAAGALQWQADRIPTERVRYSAQASTRYRYGPQQLNTSLLDALTLPEGRNPRTAALAASLLVELRNADASALVQSVLDRLRTGGYTYTLEPGLFGPDSADEFWFDRKQGFCEHIASSFVLLLRAMGIPARVVTGYQGGELNPQDGYWTVRQSDAHAWAEVWLPGRGWHRVDPTAAVSPARTMELARLQGPPSIMDRTLVNVSPQLARQLRLWWEASNNRWNQWVLNYSQARQFDLLHTLGFASPSWEDLSYLLASLMTLACAGAGAWTLWERYEHDPWLRLLQAATRRAQALGLWPAAAALPATPRALAAAVQAASHASLADRTAVANWLLQLEAWRYAPKATEQGRTVKAQSTIRAVSMGTLRRQMRQLPWSRLRGPQA